MIEWVEGTLRVASFTLDSNIAFNDIPNVVASLDSFMNQYKISIFCLSETGILKNTPKGVFFRTCWEKCDKKNVTTHNKIEAQGVSKRGSGVAIISSKNCGGVSAVIRDDDGRGLALKVGIDKADSPTTETHTILVIVVYGPVGGTDARNDQDGSFLLKEQKLKNWVECIIRAEFVDSDKLSIILGGDVNSISDAVLDSASGEMSARSLGLSRWLSEDMGGCDSFRYVHPATKGFTYIQGEAASRIDAIFSWSNALTPSASGICYSFLHTTNHFPLVTDCLGGHILHQTFLDPPDKSPPWRIFLATAQQDKGIFGKVAGVLGDLHKFTEYSETPDLLDLDLRTSAAEEYLSEAASFLLGEYDKVISEWESTNTGSSKAASFVPSSLPLHRAIEDLKDLWDHLENPALPPIYIHLLPQVEHRLLALSKWWRLNEKLLCEFTPSPEDFPLPMWVTHPHELEIENMSKPDIASVTKWCKNMLQIISQFSAKLSRKSLQSYTKKRQQALGRNDVKMFRKHVQPNARSKGGYVPKCYYPSDGTPGRMPRAGELTTAAAQEHEHLTKNGWPQNLSDEDTISFLHTHVDDTGSKQYTIDFTANFSDKEQKILDACLIKNSNDITWEIFGAVNSNLSDKEWHSLLNKRIGRAPGISGFKLPALKIFPTKVKEMARALINAIVECCLPTKSLAMALIVHIPKPNGGTRPLGLLEEILKAADWIFTSRIMRIAICHSTTKLIHHSQWAYQPTKAASSVISIDHCTVEILDNLAKKSPFSNPALLSIDLNEWFDSLQAVYADVVMRLNGVPDFIIEFFRPLVEKGSFVVATSEGLTSPMCRASGITQGGHSSPLISMLIQNPLIKMLEDLTDRPSLSGGGLGIGEALRHPGNHDDDCSIGEVLYADDLNAYRISLAGTKNLLDSLSIMSPILGIGFKPKKARILMWKLGNDRTDPYRIWCWDWRIDGPTRITLKIEKIEDTWWTHLGVENSTVRSDKRYAEFFLKIMKFLMDSMVHKRLFPIEIAVAVQLLVAPQLNYEPIACSISTEEICKIERMKNRVCRMLVRAPITTPLQGVNVKMKWGGLGVTNLISERLASVGRDLLFLLNSPEIDGKLARIRLSQCNNSSDDEGRFTFAIDCLADFGIFVRDRNENHLSRMLDILSSEKDPNPLDGYYSRKNCKSIRNFSFSSKNVRSLRKAVYPTNPLAQNTLLRIAAKIFKIPFLSVMSAFECARTDMEADVFMEACLLNIDPALLDSDLRKRGTTPDLLSSLESLAKDRISKNVASDASFSDTQIRNVGMDTTCASFCVVEWLDNDQIEKLDTCPMTMQSWGSRLPLQIGAAPCTAQTGELFGVYFSIVSSNENSEGVMLVDSQASLQILDRAWMHGPPKCCCDTNLFAKISQENSKCGGCTKMLVSSIKYQHCSNCKSWYCLECVDKAYSEKLSERYQHKHASCSIVNRLLKVANNAKKLSNKNQDWRL